MQLSPNTRAATVTFDAPLSSGSYVVQVVSGGGERVVMFTVR
jgi:hypothetical protein